MEEIVDTNIIVRLLVADHKSHLQQAVKWFREAERGERKLIIKSLVVAETCYVLECVYKKKHEEIAEGMERILSADWLEIEDRDIVHCAWDQYRKGDHFVDSFLLAWSKLHEGKILTFDQKLNKRK